MKREEAQKAIDTGLNKLNNALESGASDELTRYLEVMGKFHRYSFGNVMLILLQNPDATQVAGFQKWKELGRNVKKGEHGIGILAPMRLKKAAEDGEEEGREVRGFRIVHVFDISQTEGDALPNIGQTTGAAGDYVSRLEAAIRKDGILIETEELPYRCSGQSCGNLIKLSPNLTEAERLRVLAHEWAHERMHCGERKHQVSKTVKETEAEAVAFVVCDALGIDTQERSRDYIHLWSGSADVLKESLSLIQATAAGILDAIEQAEVPGEAQTPVAVDAAQHSACNHTLYLEDEGSTWQGTAQDDGSIHYACSECDRFYESLPGEAAGEQQPEAERLRIGRADYEQRREERIERLHARADRASSEANAKYSQAKSMASAIPFGQPILVGHHSEKSDRRYRERIHNTFGKSFELQDKARHYERRAEAAESEHAINSDDPEALSKLKEKLAGLELLQSRMKAINAAWRKAKKPDPGDDAGWERAREFLPDVPAELLTKLRRDMAQPWHIYDTPYPPYALTNNNANIRRVKERVSELSKEGQITETTNRDCGFCRVRENTEINRIQLLFDGKPADEVRAALKQHGFRWARSEQAWQRQLNSQGRRAAEWAISQLGKLLETEKETTA